jgi:hypothetical protein
MLEINAEESFMYEDIQRFGAPLECCEMVAVGIDEKRKRVIAEYTRLFGCDFEEIIDELRSFKMYSTPMMGNILYAWEQLSKGYSPDIAETP